MTNSYEQIDLYHLALTQCYRWYQVYEIPFNQARINNQLDILSDDVEIITPNGISNGKSSVAARLSKFEGWKNAHHVQNITVVPSQDDTLLLEADIVYQSMRPDSDLEHVVHYTTVLKLRDNDLPVFTNIKMTYAKQVDPLKKNTARINFQNTYVENRAKSFMHYWLYLMKTENNHHLFKELLAQDFKLRPGTGVEIDNFEKFDAWLNSIPKHIKQGSHYPKNISIKECTDHTIRIGFYFEWHSESATAEQVTTLTHNEWVLENNPDERFARIKQMNVIQINSTTNGMNK